MDLIRNENKTTRQRTITQQSSVTRHRYSHIQTHTKNHRAQSWQRWQQRGGQHDNDGNEEDPGDRDRDDQDDLQDHQAEPVPQLPVLQAAAAVQVDHRVNAGRQLRDGVSGRVPREAVAARSAGYLQHPGAAGGQRVRSAAAELRLDADANHRRGRKKSTARHKHMVEARME